MKEKLNSMLYQKVEAKGFKPSHVAEIGVWHPNTSNVYRYIYNGVRTTLVEPDPESIRLIKEKFINNRNVYLHEVAACDFNGEVVLYKRGPSTFVSNLPSSPALVNDDCDTRKTEEFTASAKLFSEIDDGTIELISIDTEGSEWFTIKNMTSRPIVISVETHGGMYTNPYIGELIKWMQDNNYTLWYKDKSDSVFVLSNVVSVTFMDKLKLFKSNLGIIFRSRKKRLRKNVMRIIGAKV
jgi:FkbM family methyltransferase